MNGLYNVDKTYREYYYCWADYIVDYGGQRSRSQQAIDVALKYLLVYICTLHSDRDHQVVFVSGLDMPVTKQIWRTAAILKNRKKISTQWIIRLVPNLAWRYTLTVKTVSLVKMSHFKKSNMSDGRHLEQSRNGHIWAIDWPIGTKFGAYWPCEPHGATV